MTKQDFTTTIVVDQTPEQVFNAVNRPQDWWSGEVKGSAAKLNDEFTYQYEDFHFTRQRVVEMVPDLKVVWLVTECLLNYVEDKHEWVDTKISFEISLVGDKTQLRFTHLGLEPKVECFDSCSSAWTQLIRQGLYSLITTGKAEKIVLA